MSSRTLEMDPMLSNMFNALPYTLESAVNSARVSHLPYFFISLSYLFL
jgi:hypothetical protein